MKKKRLTCLLLTLLLTAAALQGCAQAPQQQEPQGPDYGLYESDYGFLTLKNDEERAIYNGIGEAIENMEPEFVFTSDQAHYENRIYNIYCRWYRDHPICFWVKMESTKVFENPSQGDAHEYQLTFFYTERDKDTVARQRSELNDRLDALHAEADGLTDSEKVRFFYDYLCKYVVYTDELRWDQSCYNSLVKNKGVCSGYASALQALCLREGIPALQVFGRERLPHGADPGDNHIWNMVQLEENWYYLDPTFGRKREDRPVNYEYYLRSHAEINKDHEVDQSFCEYPKAPMDGEPATLKLEDYSLAQVEDYLRSRPEGENHMILQFAFEEDFAAAEADLASIKEAAKASVGRDISTYSHPYTKRIQLSW